MSNLGPRRNGQFMAIYLFCLHGCAWSFFCHELDSWCAQRVSTECLLACLQTESDAKKIKTCVIGQPWCWSNCVRPNSPAIDGQIKCVMNKIFFFFRF